MNLHAFIPVFTGCIQEDYPAIILSENQPSVIFSRCAERTGILSRLMRENTLCLYAKKNGFWMILLFIIAHL